jgi:hypothetical protein
MIGGKPVESCGSVALNVVNHREEVGPIVLIVVHKRPESLVDILVHDLGLAIGLRVGG